MLWWCMEHVAWLEILSYKLDDPTMQLYVVVKRSANIKGFCQIDLKTKATVL